MAKRPVSRSTGSADAPCAGQNSSSGGSRLTEVKLFAVSPTRSPLAVWLVTTVTPVAKQPKASRSTRGSNGASIGAVVPAGMGTGARVIHRPLSRFACRSMLRMATHPISLPA